MCLEEALAAIAAVRPRRAVLTHLSHDMDYGIPVSYTHLDVYKRQALYAAEMNVNFLYPLLPCVGRCAFQRLGC